MSNTENENTIGQKVDQAVQAATAALSQKVDELQAKVEELSSKIDARQGQGQSQ